ncbi:hypothetical protein EV182_003260, partial [Spiromyces aspiralis]
MIRLIKTKKRLRRMRFEKKFVPSSFHPLLFDRLERFQAFSTGGADSDSDVPLKNAFNESSDHERDTAKSLTGAGTPTPGSSGGGGGGNGG